MLSVYSRLKNTQIGSKALIFSRNPSSSIQRKINLINPINGDDIGDDTKVDEIVGSQGAKQKEEDQKQVLLRRRNEDPKKVNDTNSDDLSKKEVKDVDEIVVCDDGDDVEVCGSQGKRKRGRNLKGNTTPQKRGSKKAAVNGKDASIVAIDDTESPDDGSPQQLKGKRRVSTRNGRTNDNKATSMSKVSTQSVATQQSSQAVPDLWQEAKMTAEENSRLFAGKQIHPFFSLWKAGKKESETIVVEDDECLEKREQRDVEMGHVHVFENVKDDLNYIDWSNWSFNDGIFNNTTYNEDRKASTVKDTFGSLDLNDIPGASNPYITSLLLKGFSLSQFCGINEESSVISTSVSPIIVDEGEPPENPLMNAGKDFEARESCTHGNAGYVNSHFEQQDAVQQERIMSYYFNRYNYPVNSLWTNKYRPEKALEVCGNSEAVKFINDWLCRWHGADFRCSKSSQFADKCSMKDDEYDSSESDSDVKNEEASNLKNVLLVTGPVGSGKSAAVYACAKEQGFQIIEINASDWRNGALLKQKFGEAVESHWVKRSQESPMGKRKLKSSPIFTNEATAIDLNNGVEVISLLEEEDYVGNIGSQHHSNGRLSCDKGEIKTLILFEDVDVNLCDDRGFISTIQQLADTGKRPMILTSNNESPPLPDSLGREEVNFTLPSLKELAHHIHLVCSAEKVNTHTNLVERCVDFCKGDIRKTLMHLQFWCQSKEYMKDGKKQSESCPLMFNLDAGHCILPKLIPWELPSLLSEFIEAEVAKSLSRMEEHHSVLGMIQEEEELGNNSIHDELDCDNERASIEAKKEAILSGNCFIHVDNDIMAGSNACEFSNSSCSPVAFTRRNIRRKSDTVLSESEDEICNLDNPAVSDGLSSGNITSPAPAFHPQSPTLNSALKGFSNEFSEHLRRSGEREVVAARHQSSETAHNLINFFARGNSCNQSTEPAVHSAEVNPECLESAHANCSGHVEANDSVDLLNNLVVHTQDGNIELNMHQNPVVDYQNFPAMGNSKNQLVDQSFYFGEVNRVEVGTGNAAILSLNPLNDQVQLHREEKNTAKRCLFPHPAQTNPDSRTVGSPKKQSTGQLIHCVKPSMTEPLQWPLDMGILNHRVPLFDQLRICTDVCIGDTEQPQTDDANPLRYTALGNSLNPSNDQLFQFIEAKEKEIQQQHLEAGDRMDGNCVAVDGSLNQLSDQVFGIDWSVNNQRQLPQIADLNNVSCLQLDASLRLISEQLHCREEKAESAEQQLPDTAIASPAAVGKTLKFTELKTEEHQFQYSDATNANHVTDHCQSLDMSIVPESTFVPETEVNDGTECPTGTDLMEIMSSVVIGNGEPSTLGCQASEYRFFSRDLNENPKDEEMGDSQTKNEHLEPSTSGCPVMDECSRMDFFKTSKNFRIPALETKNSVQERWDELRKTDLGQYFLSENKNARQLLDLGFRMSNLISEGDLLLHDCELLINDSSGPVEEIFTFGWLDRHVQMASSIAQYGYLLYAKDIDSLQSRIGVANKLHLGWEMLVSTSNSMAVGKLLSLNRSPNSLPETSLKQEAKAIDISFTRDREVCLQNIVQSVVPWRSFLALRGNALHDYLSSLSLISSSEASRLAEAAEKSKRRRVRAAKNYLSHSAPDLSQDDISKLIEYNTYRRGPSKVMHESPGRKHQ